MDKSEEQITFKQKDDEDRNTCCLKLQERSYRRKFYFTLYLFCGSFAYGWIQAQIGPSLLDLMLITGADITKGSALLTALSVGKLVGVLLGGKLIDSCNRYSVIITCLLGISITSFIKPWCYVYWTMVAISGIQGVNMGVWTLGANSLCARIWGKGKDGRPFMQALHFSCSLGGVLSPFATKPFLSLEPCHDPPTAAPEGCSRGIGNITYMNFTSHPNFTRATSNGDIDGYMPHKSKESNVYIALMISGIIMTLSAVPFIVGCIRRKEDQLIPVSTPGTELPSIRRTLSVFWRLVILYLLGQMLFAHNATEFNFPSLLALFCVEKLGWSKSKSSDITSLYYGTFSVSRLLGILLSNFLSPSVLIPSSLFGLVISFLTLYLEVTLRIEPLIWIAVAMIGISMSWISASMFTWIQENVMTMTGKVTAYLIVSGNMAGIVLPILIGYLVEERDPIWFVYVLSATVLICSVTYICLRIAVRFKIN